MSGDPYSEKDLMLAFLKAGTQSGILQRPRIKPNMTEKKRSMKWFLMIFCYTHRSMPSSDIIREASFCNSFFLKLSLALGTNTETPPARHYTERERDRIEGERASKTQYERGGLHRIHPFRAQGAQREGREGVRVRGNGTHQENKAFRINMSKAHTNSQIPK